MSRRGGLLCSLPVVAVALAGVVGAARVAVGAPVQPAAPSKLIDVKSTGDPMLALPDQAAAQQTWALVLDDLAVHDGDAPVVSGGATLEEQLRPAVRSPNAPPIIAAPLPPAIISGLIGLAGVYAYKRRSRLR